MKKCDCSCKCSLTSRLKESSAAIWLLALCSFLLGIIVGFWWSPVKNGMTIGSNNVTNSNNIKDEDEEYIDYGFDDEED